MVSHKSDLICAHSHLGAVIETHSENMPSLRIDKPFPGLLQHAVSLDLASMDPTDHGHIPYVVILVRAMEEWKSSVGGEDAAQLTR
jgi:amyloid beta precursor protein binding protein 1